ncbi:hypothetical protein LOZ51_002557 [Ophidiomyces ophidiicola]|nr:hypothetical protein LOZ55_004470 [Ophidiomyces ophidiicola]KAI1980190.1 hypothetical protein LOZ54_005906 [Ophidiomyces ophidiicola]KAI1997885.1 hypothetical protein LOZ51_002557 [Ophidiomyces ophidiicola]
MSSEELAKKINDLVALGSTTNLEAFSYYHHKFCNYPRVVFSEKLLPQDAVATILLDGRRGEVYSVCVQVDHDRDVSKRAVILYISTSQKMSMVKTLYLEQIWDLLQKRAQCYAENARERELLKRQQVQGPLDFSGPARPTPTVPSDLYHQMMRVVYKQCFERWFKWIQTAHADMSRFKTTFREAVGEDIALSNPYDYWWLEPLSYLLEQYTWVFESTEALKSQGRDPVEIVAHADFAVKMERLESAYTIIERDDVALGTIEEWQGAADEQEVPIAVHLRRFAEFQISIVQLERLTQSHRSFMHYKNKPLEVVYIDDLNPSPLRTLYPTDTNTWKESLRHALHSRGFKLRPEYNDRMESHLAPLCDAAEAQNQVIRPAVHPPTQLLQFFLTYKISPPPFSYIGSSRPICAACAAVFVAWDQLYETPSYMTRGSDGVYPFPWHVPTQWSGSTAPEDGGMLEMVYKKIAARLAGSLFEGQIAMWREGMEPLFEYQALPGEDVEMGGQQPGDDVDQIMLDVERLVEDPEPELDRESEHLEGHGQTGTDTLEDEDEIRNTEVQPVGEEILN